MEYIGTYRFKVSGDRLERMGKNGRRIGIQGKYGR
jgi:hypothetical protein